MSGTWKALFAAEILICLGTVGYWALAPWDFLTGVYHAPAHSWSHYFLLQQAGIVVFCAYVYLYARLLFARPFDLRPFRYLQEALAIGDGVLIASAPLLHRVLRRPCAVGLPEAHRAKRLDRPIGLLPLP